LRVAFLFNHDYFLGGGERSTAELIRSLDREALTPVVLLPGPGELHDHFSAAGIAVHEVPLPTLRAWATGEPFKALWNLQRLLRTEAVDVLHTGSTRACLYGGLAGRLAGIPVIWHVRESLRDLYWYDRLLAGLATRLVCVSAGVRDQRFERHGAGQRAKALVVHNAVDTKRLMRDAEAGTVFRSSLGVGPDEVLLGLVGNVIERKGHDVCTKALALALRNDPALSVRLLCIGREDLEAEFAAMVRNLVLTEDLTGRVLFEPFTRNVVGLYSALDVLVLPTRSEGFSRALIEAMSMGLPVVASDLAEIREAVPDAGHALLSPYGEIQPLADNLILLAQDGELRERMGAANRARAVAEFDLAAHARTVENEYFQVLAAHGGTLRRAAKRTWLASRGVALTLVPRSQATRPETLRRVLLLAPPRLGDTALALAVPRQLKELLPGVRIDVLCGRYAAALVRMSPHVDEVVEHPPGRLGLLRTAHALRGSGYDALLDLNLDWRLGTPLAARLIGGFSAGYDVAGRSPLYNLPLPGPDEALHVAEAYTALVSACCWNPAHKNSDTYDKASSEEASGGGPVAPLLEVPPQSAAALAARFQAAGIGADEPVVVVHPGATHPSQHWGTKRFAALADGVAKAGRVRVVLVGGPGDAGLLGEVVGSMSAAPALVAMGLEVGELAALLVRASVFAGNNSGPLHLAAALGRPTVSTMGPTLHGRWTPRGVGHAVLRASELGCIGCNLAHCPLGQPECMRRIGVDAMLEAVRKALGSVGEVGREA